MKHLFSIVFAIVLFAGVAWGQREVVITENMTTDVGGFIKADSTGRRAAAPQQTIYILKRNGVYKWVSSINNNYDYFLYIKGEEGVPGVQSYPAYVSSWPNANNGHEHFLDLVGRYGARLENIEFDMAQENGGFINRSINLAGPSRLYIKNCILEHDNGAIVSMSGDSGSVYLEDCFIHSCAHRKAIGGNGRIINTGGVWTDTLSMINCTAFNIFQRGIRLAANSIDYIKVDHCTIFQIDRDGVIDAGAANTFICTNNIFFDSPAGGGYLTDNIGPGQYWWCNMVRMDTVKNRDSIKFSNNNFYFQEKYKAVWRKHRAVEGKWNTDLPFPDSASYAAWQANPNRDTVAFPGFVRKQLRDAIDTSKAYFKEVLNFKTPPADLVAWADSRWTTPNGVLAENWYMGANDSINMSYPTTARSYTAGINGYPLGDLNWFPLLKTKWKNGEVLVGVEKTDLVPAESALRQNYPNPFNPSTQITYTVAKTNFVSLKVYDLLGREVATLVNDLVPAGEYTARWNAAGLSSGVYFYKMQAGSFVATKRMIFMK